jgi:hypothetical protein
MKGWVVGRLLRSWRAIRWLAFFISVAADAYIFYIAVPFTALSFLASGLAAVLLFFVFLEVALQMRGRRRVRSALDDNEEIFYQVGKHLFALLRNIREHPIAWYLIWLPLLVAFIATGVIGFLLWQYFMVAKDGVWLTYAAYACGGYLLLLLAIPFVLEHVSEWRSYQHVIVTDVKSGEPKLLLHHGVLDYDLQTIPLERTVTTRLHQSLWESMVGIGDVELRETAGSGETLQSLWRPRRFEKKIRGAIKGMHRKGSASDTEG